MSEQVRNLINNAGRAIKDGFYETAENFIGQALSLEPNNFKAARMLDRLQAAVRRGKKRNSLFSLFENLFLVQLRFWSAIVLTQEFAWRFFR